MASSTPFGPITSSRGAADTTAGRIYFSTPSAQIRMPLTGPFLFPPYFCSHYSTTGVKYKGSSAEGSRGGRERRRTAGRQPAEKLSAGVKSNRRRHIYPGQAQVPKFSKKNPKIVAQCRKYPIPNFNTLPKQYLLLIH